MLTIPKNLLPASLILSLLGMLLMGAANARAATLPEGFAETRIATGLNPTSISFAPDGRLALCEKQGLLYLIEGGQMPKEPCLDLSARLDSWNERGLLSVCFDPEFDRNGWLYVYYTHNRDPSDASHQSSNNRVSRFTLKGDTVDPSSEVVLLEVDDLSKIGWHNGGGLEFGMDGKLYLSTGENSKAPNAQSGENLLGKLLRINKDGSIPTDNPHYFEYSGKNRAIVALGLRNPFAIARQPDSGLLYLCVVGARYEQIMRYDSSAKPVAVNYGWPDIDGPLRNGPLPENYRAPDYAYDHGEGQGLALCGGDFYNPSNPGPDAFPDSFKGKFFFGDYGGWIKLIDPADPGQRLDFATGIDRALDVAIAPDGALWYLERAGIPGGSDAANSASGNGSLWRVRWEGLSESAEVAALEKAKGSQVDAGSSELGLPSLEITPAGGSFSGPVWVRISGGSPGAAIHFTVDGKRPDSSSPRYEAPFQIAGTSTIKAIALGGDGADGEASSATFAIEGDVPYGMDFRPAFKGAKLPAGAGEGLPATLSATGLFANENLSASVGLVPYSLNATVWADNATAQRWVALPESTKIGFAPNGEYTWPGGTIFAQSFEIVTNEATGESRRLETRLLVLDETGSFGYGANYRWRPDNSDADLVAIGGEEEVLQITDASGTRREQTWTYPARGLCYMCHTQNAGFVLGPKTRQLNGIHAYGEGRADNQLRAWNYLQMFAPAVIEDDISGYASACRIDDPSAPLEDRVRSYLDANCSSCHRPSGTGALWDARLDVPLAGQAIIEGAVRNTLGIDEARVVAPGDVARSILHARMASTSPIEQMPPLARNVVDQVALEAIAEWIRASAAESE